MNLEKIVLNHGGHRNPEDGHCLLEVVSMFAGEPFGDSPACVDPSLATFGRHWNDGMRSDEERDQLKQYIARLPGTAKDLELSQKRGWMAADWLIRTHTTAWLAMTPALAHHAEAIKAHPPITCPADLERVQPLLDAAKAAAKAAAKDAAWAAAWDAARAAAGDAARAAAGDAARAAAWAAAGAAARVAAKAAAGDAAWVAAKAAAYKAGEEGAVAALEPTTKQLQASAHELYSAMIDAGVSDAEA